ncbi:MAG: hypothetical protein ACE14Q_01125 [Acidobacteriota bacterium]
MRYENFLRNHFFKILALCLILLTADIFILTFGVLRLEKRAQNLKTTVEKGEEEIKKLETKAEEKEKEVKTFKESKEVIETLKNNIFLKRSQRFVDFQKEISRITREAGMESQKFGYKYTLVPKDTEKEAWKDSFVEVYMTLPLQGTYPQIKKLLSLLEESGHFITIEGIDIGQTTQGATLMDFKVGIKTYFVYDPNEDIIEEKK